MNHATFQPLVNKTFRFRCHKGIRCFNECCADLKLALTPYDILRIKNRLGMGSGEFLDTFTRTVCDHSSRFPRSRRPARSSRLRHTRLIPCAIHCGVACQFRLELHKRCLVHGRSACMGDTRISPNPLTGWPQGSRWVFPTLGELTPIW